MKTQRTTILLSAAAVLLLSGCDTPDQAFYAGFQAEDPAVRIDTIHRAGTMKDPGSVPFLVDRLTDSERDVRFFAIIALERITGETMGWRYSDGPAEQAEAVDRWRDWLRSRRREAPTTRPVPSGATSRPQEADEGA